MTTTEFSDQFDVLFNNVTSNQAPGLDEYEKSVFLTKAQRELVEEHFNSRIDQLGGGFDGSQKRQYDFSSLLRTEKLHNVNLIKDRVNIGEKLDNRSKVFLFPQNYFLAVNEIISDDKTQYSVLPLEYSEYQRLMLKPYKYPVKRAAWRIITDKKNCNYFQEYKKDILGNTTSMDYNFLTSWADQKRKLQVKITWKDMLDPNEQIEDFQCSDTNIKFKTTLGVVPVYAKIVAPDCGWNNAETTYEVELELYTSIAKKSMDDEAVIELLQKGFAQFAQYIKKYPEEYPAIEDYEIYKAAHHTDGFQTASAPSKADEFLQEEGKTFTTEVISLPLVEIIGVFSSEPSYMMRYVKTLNPIILGHLGELSIENLSEPTECELPEEAHQEILERAVTLAKIAWAGETSTTAHNQSQQQN